MRRLTIAIDAGETTCAREPGKFCKYVGTAHFGQRFVCGLFPREKMIEDVGGWLQRLPECIAAEKEG